MSITECCDLHLINMKSIILISTLALVHCMPSNLPPSENKPSVEIEKQELVELTPSTKISHEDLKKKEKMDESTREILAKIAQVNRNQGYAEKAPAKAKFSLLPHYYSFSHEQPKPVGKYFYDVPNFELGHQQQAAPTTLLGDHQHPKRKISRQEIYLVPNQNLSPQIVLAPIPKLYFENEEALKMRTVENVKDIMVQAQLPPNTFSTTYYNPILYGFTIQNYPPLMLNSMTTVEEYDQSSGCNSQERSIKQIENVEDDRTNADIEVHLDNVVVTDDKANFSVNKNRNEKEIQEQLKRPKPLLFFAQQQQHHKPESEDEQNPETESEDDKTVITSDKKLFSKDSIGDGIFIHRLKVRKGGVAIAGPGGIATAGSGGTAIVGPNGWAYTHPDSLAIAGTGTKVIAVDPNIKLGDLIKNNVTRKGVSHTRIGKVVAVGPVIYYNRG